MYADVQVYRRWAYQKKKNKVAHTIQIVTAYDDDTKNEFYISTFAIIYIIYDAMGNVVKLRPLKTQVLVYLCVCVCVCVGHPSAAEPEEKLQQNNYA